MSAIDLVQALGEEGKMGTLTVKVTPETKEMIKDLRKRTGKGPSEITQRAFDSFFEGYEMMEDSGNEDEVAEEI